jgi:hypothetical protein
MRWRDRQGDVWDDGRGDGLLRTPETAPFPRWHVEKKWGPLVPLDAEIDVNRLLPEHAAPLLKLEHEIRRSTALRPTAVMLPGPVPDDSVLLGLPVVAGDRTALLYEPAETRGLPLHRTEAGWPRCSTCDGGGCPDCTDPAG